MKSLCKIPSSDDAFKCHLIILSGSEVMLGEETVYGLMYVRTETIQQYI